MLVGENAELFCDVNAFPVPTIWWYKDGRTVFPSEASRNDKDFVLAIREAQVALMMSLSIYRLDPHFMQRLRSYKLKMVG